MLACVSSKESIKVRQLVFSPQLFFFFFFLLSVTDSIMSLW